MNNHNADVLVIVFEKERTSVTCWPPSRNLGALGRGTCSSVQTSADLNSGQNRAFSQFGILIVCVFVWDMMQLDSGVFGLCCWSCARLNRITSSREPKSAYMVSLTSRCPVSDTPQTELALRLAFVVYTKNKVNFSPEFFWREKQHAGLEGTIAKIQVPVEENPWKKSCSS